MSLKDHLSFTERKIFKYIQKSVRNSRWSRRKFYFLSAWFSILSISIQLRNDPTIKEVTNFLCPEIVGFISREKLEGNNRSLVVEISANDKNDAFAR